MAVLPAALVVAKFSFRDVLLTGDLAIIDARVRDIGSGVLPLLGPYSFGWSHPGPLFFYLLAPLSLLTGGAPWALVVGGAILHLVATALTARLAWRHGGLALTLGVLAVCSLSTLGATDRILLDPWNPHVAMPFVVLFILQSWSVMIGDRWQLVGATIVGSFLVQTHLGYAPIVLAGLLSAGVVVALDLRTSHAQIRAWTRPVTCSIVAFAVLWSTALWDQATGDPGNMTLISRYFAHSPEGQLGMRAGLGTFAALFRPAPVWLGGRQRLVPLSFRPRPESLWWLLVPTCLLTTSFVVARLRGLRDVARLVGLVAVIGVTGAFALSRLKTHAWSYMSLWRIPIAVLIVAVSLWGLWQAWATPPRAARVLALGAALVAILGGVIPVSRDVLATSRVASGDACAAPIVSQAASVRPPGRVLVRSVAPALWGVTQALIDDLDRRGVDVVVDEEVGKMWGSRRVIPQDGVDAVWIVTEDGMRGVLLRASPDATLIARTSPLSDEREAELSALQLALAQQLTDLGRPDLIPWLDYRDFVTLVPEQVPQVSADAIARISQLLEMSIESGTCRATVVQFAPGDLDPALTDG